LTEFLIDPQKLDFIDVVSSSHNHTDHLDAETLLPLMRVNPDLKMVIPEANRDFVAQRLGCNPQYPMGLNGGERLTIGHFTFTGIPAAHNELETDEQGRCKFMGYVLSFGPWHVYHSGDTLWRTEILEALAPFSLDLALLPINGNKPERRVAGNLNATEAVALAKETKAKMLIPCHYDMFTFNTSDPKELATAATDKNQAFKILKCGEKWSSPSV